MRIAVVDLRENKEKQCGEPLFSLLVSSHNCNAATYSDFPARCFEGDLSMPNLLPLDGWPGDLDQKVEATQIGTGFRRAIQDPSILSRLEEDEIMRPIAQKVLADRDIYYSRSMCGRSV